jgi:hypothetical protein
MNMLKTLASLLMLAFVVACGGGGGDAGSSGFSGVAVSPGTTVTPGGAIKTTYVIGVEIQRAGVSSTQISSTETAQAVATVTSSAGAPIEGVVVSFSQTVGTLLTFAPLAATALTDAAGKAKLDLSAANAANTGATTVQASATVESVAISSSKSIQISAGTPVVGGTPIPAAINFVGSVPSGTAIVIKGAGGNGRSESAILTFRVVDKSNAPINGARVDFAINADNGGAAIAAPGFSISNSDGLVNVTVSSGSTPASIVVKSTVNSAPSIASQSDTLIVSNSVPIAGGFEIVAEKYNLDGRLTGDKTKITAFVRDIFGNPVPDGVAVSFQTDFGVIALSTLGGCVSVNGTCTVEFRVQDPRGDGIATVRGSVRVGTNNTLADQLRINMAGATGTAYTALDDNGRPLTKLTLNSCKQTFEVLVSDGKGRSTAAGTTVTSSFASSGVAVALKAGTPVPDQLTQDFPPTPIGFEVDVTGSTVSPPCSTAAGATIGARLQFFRLEFKTPNGVASSQRIELEYPQ